MIDGEYFEEIKAHSNGYAQRLAGLYRNQVGCTKFFRLGKIISHFREKIGLERKLLDVGCGPGFLSLEAAEKLRYTSVGIDFSINEIRIANQELEARIQDKGLISGQVKFYADNLFNPSNPEWVDKYDIVACVDVLGSYEGLPRKHEFVSELCNYAADKGNVVITALCCQNPEMAERYRNGEVISYKIEGKNVKVHLHSETVQDYLAIFIDIVGKFRKSLGILRLDEESVLFHLY